MTPSPDAAGEAEQPIVVVPADLEIDDKVIGPFTARQSAILAVGALLAWLAVSAMRGLVPLSILAGTALVLLGVLTAGLSVRRDGVSLERFAGFAVRFAMRPKKLASAPGGDARVPQGVGVLPPTAASVFEPGVLEVGQAGSVAMVECGTVNFGLCSGAEARAALWVLGGALNAIGSRFQVTALSYQIDLHAHAARVERDASYLDDGALREAAFAHARFLRKLTADGQMYGRRVLLVVREPAPAANCAAVLAARAAQCAQLLSACGVTARVLSTDEAAAVLAAACDPQRGPAATTLALSEPQHETELT